MQDAAVGDLLLYLPSPHSLLTILPPVVCPKPMKTLHILTTTSGSAGCPPMPSYLPYQNGNLIGLRGNKTKNAYGGFSLLGGPVEEEKETEKYMEIGILMATDSEHSNQGACFVS